MALHPVWLDYASYVSIILGVLLGFFAHGEVAGPRRGWLQLSAFVLIGVGIVVAGTGGVIANVRSPKPTITGVLFDVRHHPGGRSSFTTFRVLSDGGPSETISTNVDFKEVENDETTRVTFQPYSGRALYLEIVKGNSAGWTYRGSDGLFGSWIVILGGFITTCVGIFRWLVDHNAEVTEVDSATNLDGDVDTRSLLNLSNNE